MYKQFFLPIFFMLCMLPAIVQGQPLETIIKTQAMDMARAVLAKDVNRLAAFLPPRLVAEAGGKDKLMMARDTINKYMQQFGTVIKKVVIGNPGKILHYKNQLQATLPQTTEISFMASMVTLESTLVAFSEDGGRHWYFADTGIYRAEKLKNSLPDLSPELVIPPRQPPRIRPAEQ